MSDDQFVIPEYKIDLLTKSKKLVNAIENIDQITVINNVKKSSVKLKKVKTSEINKSTEKSKKNKSKKKIRTLWIRRKKKLN